MTARKQFTIGELERNGAIIAIQDGNHGEKHPVAADYVTTGIPFLMASDIKDGTVDLVNCKFITKAQADRLRIGFARSGDVLLTHKGTVGNVAVLPQIDGYVMLTPQVTYYRLNDEKLSNRYLRYAFAEPSFQGRLIARSAQSTRPYIGITAQRDLEIAWVERHVQEQIACVLSAYDDLIENNTRRIRVLEQMARMLYREWFVNFRFPGHEKVRMVDCDAGRIPEGWSLESVGTTSLNFDSKRKPLSSIERSTRKGPYPYYGAAKIFDFIDDYIFNGVYLLVGEDGSVITPDRKPVLQLTDGKFWPNNHTHVLQGKFPVSTYYLYLTLADADVSGCVTGAAQPKITQANLNRIAVTVPTTELLKEFNSLTTPMFLEIALLHSKSGNLGSTRDLILPKLVSGEINVEQLETEVAAQNV